jgi:hypothetical protein
VFLETCLGRCSHDEFANPCRGERCTHAHRRAVFALEQSRSLEIGRASYGVLALPGHHDPDAPPDQYHSPSDGFVSRAVRIISRFTRDAKRVLACHASKLTLEPAPRTKAAARFTAKSKMASGALTVSQSAPADTTPARQARGLRSRARWRRTTRTPAKACRRKARADDRSKSNQCARGPL